MTDLDEGAVRPGGDSTQWADYGVNVGHNVYGGIHVHPPFPSAGPPRLRPGAAGPLSKRRHAALRSALTALADACEEAAAALSHIGLMGPERRSDDHD
ncbi:hypothetical protein DV517_57310 [Streptomyces sp. S816]|nr:hypothetical protein DV517_57310 [Streptomyces sp. S816]